MTADYDPYLQQIGTTPDDTPIWGYRCQDCGVPCDESLICDPCDRKQRHDAGLPAYQTDTACFACGALNRHME